MLQRDAARKAGIITPAQGGPNTQIPQFGDVAADEIVLLDGESNAQTNAFVSRGEGRPHLRMASVASTDSGGGGDSCDLRQPQRVLAAGVRVLESRFPNEPRQNLPPVIKSICDLWDMLASLR